jgi:hypothetical protein
MEIKALFREVKYPIELFDKNGRLIYNQFSINRWIKWEFDENGKQIYLENSKGYWSKSEYDVRGDEIYYEDSNCYWVKREYVEKGNLIYLEDSSYGIRLDKRPKPNKVITINGIDIELTNEAITKLKEALK